MKSKSSSLLVGSVLTALLPVSLLATPAQSLEGFTFGSTSNLSLVPSGANLTLKTTTGELLLQSSHAATGAAYDGGLRFVGTPVRFILGTAAEPSGAFEIYGSQDAIGTDLPIFSVTYDDTIGEELVNIFSSLEVGGQITSGGSPVATMENIQAIMAQLSGKLVIGNGTGNATKSVAIGGGSPSATGLSAVALGQGTASGNYSFASGPGAVASQEGSVAIGGSANATGYQAAAIGNGQAHAQSSFAAGSGYVYPNGLGSVALAAGTTSGWQSFSAGAGTQATNWGMTSLGMFPTNHGGSYNSWVATDTVFVVGNGTDWPSANRSDAIVTKKNGKTQLTNKYWSPGANALLDPVANSATDADGVALEVSGHTVLRGKVTIEKAQGGIAVGIYQ